MNDIILDECQTEQLKTGFSSSFFMFEKPKVHLYILQVEDKDKLVTREIKELVNIYKELGYLVTVENTNVYATDTQIKEILTIFNKFEKYENIQEDLKTLVNFEELREKVESIRKRYQINFSPDDYVKTNNDYYLLSNKELNQVPKTEESLLPKSIMIPDILDRNRIVQSTEIPEESQKSVPVPVPVPFNESVLDYTNLNEKERETNGTEFSYVYIIYNNEFEFVKVYIQSYLDYLKYNTSASFRISSDETIYQIINNKQLMEEYGFEHYKSFKVFNDNILKMSQELNNEYMSKDVLNSKLDIIEKISLINKTETSKVDVIEYIKNRYIITNLPDKCIKASHILNDLNQILKDKLSYNKMSLYLIDLGLKKKRMQDGIYYYGLELNSKYNNSSNEDLNDIEIVDNISKKRNEQISFIFSTPTV